MLRGVSSLAMGPATAETAVSIYNSAEADQPIAAPPFVLLSVPPTRMGRDPRHRFAANHG